MESPVPVQILAGDCESVYIVYIYILQIYTRWPYYIIHKKDNV